MNKADFSFTYHTSQRDLFRKGDLIDRWVAQYPQLFDQKTVAVARRDSKYHFFEWLSAVLLYEAAGLVTLIEQYVAKSHPSKRDTFRRIVGDSVFDHVDRNQPGLPDLFVYDPVTLEWFFCEVKGGPDRVRERQLTRFAELSKFTKKAVRLLELKPVKL